MNEIIIAKMFFFKGDSGGPMVVEGSDGIFVLVGLTSFGINCTAGYPGVYTRVSSFLKIIHDTMEKRN